MTTFNSLKIDCWFPTTVGIVDCPFFNKNKYLNYFLSKKTNEGFNDYQLHKDKKLKDLNDWIALQVNEYSKKHNFHYEYEPKESWFIDYKKYEGNEWHTHSGYTISTVFILEATPGEVYTRFRNPVFDQKNPQNNKVKDDYKLNNFNDYTFPTCEYDSVPGRLLIFRSHTLHCSDQLLTDNKRLIISINFDPKGEINEN